MITNIFSLIYIYQFGHASIFSIVLCKIVKLVYLISVVFPLNAFHLLLLDLGQLSSWLRDTWYDQWSSECIWSASYSSFSSKHVHCQLALATQFIWLPKFSNWFSSSLRQLQVHCHQIELSPNTKSNHLHFSAFCWRSASSSIFSSRRRSEFCNISISSFDQSTSLLSPSSSSSSPSDSLKKACEKLALQEVICALVGTGNNDTANSGLYCKPPPNRWHLSSFSYPDWLTCVLTLSVRQTRRRPLSGLSSPLQDSSSYWACR